MDKETFKEMIDAPRRFASWRDLPLDLVVSAGTSLLVLSPFFLQNIGGSASFWAFDTRDSYVFPHLQGLFVFWLPTHLIVMLGRRFNCRIRNTTIIVEALMLLFVVRGLISVAGVLPRDLSNKLHDWLTIIWRGPIGTATLRRAGVFIIFGLGAILFWWAKPERARLFRAYCGFGFVLGTIALFRAVPMMATDAEYLDVRHRTTHEARPLPAVERRVVWVLFDEFDYSRFFQARHPRLALPNLDRLRHNSISAENAVPPAWGTGVSVPALTVGSYLSDTRPVGAGTLMLKQKDGQEVDWRDASTVFSRLRASGKHVSILGFAFPYCNIFPYADPCFSAPASAYGGWWWGIWQALKVIPGVEQLLVRGNRWNSGDMERITRLQLAEIERHLSDATTALSFIHFNFPHLPGGRLREDYQDDSIKELPGYDQNALTVDRTVGRIINQLEHAAKSQDVLLIVSSDHWLRAKSILWDLPPDQAQREFGEQPEEVHKIPLFIRRIRETSEHVVVTPISTVNTVMLVEDFLAGRVTDHNSIARWWLDKPYFEPMVPEGSARKDVGVR